MRLWTSGVLRRTAAAVLSTVMAWNLAVPAATVWAEDSAETGAGELCVSRMVSGESDPVVLKNGDTIPFFTASGDFGEFTLCRGSADAPVEKQDVSVSVISHATQQAIPSDVITVEDKSDPYVSEMLSIGGFTVKNNLGGVVPYVIVRTNQKEVDPLLGSISETAPSNPEEGDFWYQVDHSAQTVTLMKYSGSAWAAATEKQSLTYTWYAQDKDGHAAEFDKAGKVIYLSAADIDSILTLQCDVSN